MKKNNDEIEQNDVDREIVGNEELQRDFRQYANSTKTIENYGGESYKKNKRRTIRKV